MTDAKETLCAEQLREACIRHFVSGASGYSEDALAAIRVACSCCVRAGEAKAAGRLLVWVAQALHRDLSAPSHAQQLVALAHAALGFARREGTNRIEAAAADTSLRAFATQRRDGTAQVLNFRIAHQPRQTP